VRSFGAPATDGSQEFRECARYFNTSATNRNDGNLLKRRRVGYDPVPGDSRVASPIGDASGVQLTSHNQERPLGFLRTDDRADRAQRKMPIPAFA
jgi:hypothetical protein